MPAFDQNGQPSMQQPLSQVPSSKSSVKPQPGQQGGPQQGGQDAFAPTGSGNQNSGVVGPQQQGGGAQSSGGGAQSNNSYYPPAQKGVTSDIAQLPPQANMSPANTTGGDTTQANANSPYTPAGYANITGLDTNKLNDPNKHDVKYDAHSRAFSAAVGATNAGNADPSLSASDPNSMATVIQRLQQSGFPNAHMAPGSGQDKIDYGDGTVVDVRLNGGQGGWGWLPQQGAEAQANGDGGGANGPGGSYGGQSFGPPLNFPSNFQAYHAGQLPTTQFSTYNPGQLSKYHNMDFSQTQGSENQILQQILNSGGSLNPQVQAQMQAQLKDQALAMQSGQSSQINQNAANSGLLGSGMQSAQQQNLGQQTQSNLLSGYRDLGVQAAQTNRQDQLNALSGAEGVMSGQLGRYGQQYGQNFNTELAQEGLNQAGVQSQNAATQFALQRALEQEGLNQAQSNSQQGFGSLGLQQMLGMGGLQNQANSIANQFNLGQQGIGFNYAQLGQNANQFGLGMGFNYANLQNQMNQNQLAALLKSLGGA